ncbi:DUF3134 domain-containing protein [Cyanobacterium aponinum AL20118]|uniref:DUF3134 domain-containing protein n=2 Tax=Cyanobacterium aponinum TaxID=379064 RepID=A0A844GYZ5_9CHRO|nr:DUF3134 domain-containing protein [Cyanobacterium aponinum]MBD2394702.1 DUF3134 domain-containing protein [Cyanobacterium aponinum FACHB-4101]MTF40168.1 DUF3134 domain-containing protein [Cyanobacterium aponinum 0216]PHV63779.1 hypothetical protein CSQ80_02910 [Cyanobacterium aponinum IPPAS B-1201]WPF88076.1 DUF3134 domain-containing protein [Cyanobacterium aponinum AL20115]WRL37185.1 DUF3134 domain-containing protein [Cyanobacterium aponinum UTEX 3221]
MKNPALRKEKRYEPAPVIPLKQDGSLLDWLEANDRIIYREEREDRLVETAVTEDEEISDLIEGEEDEFDPDELDDFDDDEADIV